jgi:catechol 2,3-dioxygenase-like lactoylglutathione lyase family enzyme
MASRITEIVIDCPDPDQLVGFWSAALGYVEDGRDDEDGEWIALKGPEGSGPVVLLVRVPDAKAAKNRLHLDLSPTDRDMAEEVERLIGLGARHVDIGQGQTRWTVLADPAGNEFCVLSRRVEPLG